MKIDIKIVAFNMYDTWVHMRNDINPYKNLFNKLWIQDNIRQLSQVLQTTDQDIQDVLPQACFERDDIDILLKQFNEDIQKQLQSILIYDDFISTIDFVKNNWYQTAIISNLSKIYAYPLTHLSWKWKFDHEVLSFEVWEIKPNIWIFQQLQKKSWIAPENTIMVWDSFSSDVRWAHNAWIYPFHIVRSSTWIQDKWRYAQISTLEDLKEIL